MSDGFQNTTLATPRSSAAPRPLNRPAEWRLRTWVVPTVCVAAGFAPILLSHVLNLISRPHYQYVVIVPIAVWAVWRKPTQSAEAAEVSPRLSWAATVTLLASLIGLATATWIRSPWLGAVAGVLALLPCLWWQGGGRAWRTGWRSWVLTWLLVPLPFGLDEDLTRRLRTVTTEWTSRVLDQLGILHLSYANVIELPGKPLFIADACSGIHSLFVLLAAALVVAMWNERSLLHAGLLLATTFLIVLFENVARLTIVAYGLRFRMDLSEGPDHLAMGAVLFALSLLLMCSADQLLMFLLPKRRRDDADDRRATQTSKTSANDSPLPDTVSRTALLLAACFPLLGIAQLFRMPPVNVAAVFSRDLKLPEFGAEALPAELAGFKRLDYRTVTRVPGDPLGRDSQQWTFEKGRMHAMISLDSPYDGVHDLTLCYGTIGWSIPEKRIIPPDDLPSGEGPVAMAKMERSLYGHALLLFSLSDSEGKVDAVIKDLARGNVEQRAGRRFRTFLETQQGETPPQSSRGPYVQFQMLGRFDSESTEVETRKLLELYIAARAILRERCLHLEADQSR